MRAATALAFWGGSQVSMPSAETLLSEALAKWAPVANSGVEANKQGWLTVSWCYETGRVQYGCRFCERALEQGKMHMPNRYRDKTKAHSFAYGNVYKNLGRAVNFHKTTKIHQRSIEMVDSVHSIEANSRVDKEWEPQNPPQTDLRTHIEASPSDLEYASGKARGSKRRRDASATETGAWALMAFRNIYYLQSQRARLLATLRAHTFAADRQKADEAAFCACVASLIADGYNLSDIKGMLNGDTSVQDAFRSIFMYWVEVAAMRAGREDLLRMAPSTSHSEKM